ncbi:MULTISPECIES: FAD:protein FMN transferase [unclassified Bifidobacterium]|uniref:FAD:protein FMN transferase n=1 Tax=unclassified Bifidobacterium TaxID=2608897 RepID=UPI001129A8A4|nr:MULTISPECIES: FAD:protein FMN transferase [unclassified Bifidobacterium]TPF77950.1 thiamine biosynthesis protein ApbE [Bifidobacterium sp. UTCIF-1]TPF80171.1 thiamine biosynthesis protein ApbE [Bifidobacterium sp. UTCIF-24]TPF82977.1 thiamine biosynthesis protein ApbE [Bifidobacterium sp. UTCIF-3]TPF83884.1 thiamine biosynthesis protein ApbE [Bifidobacterium sp. UTCIF-36]TPF90646.1 thiamine biosynthesis protein ApbE [Bifidobacterium sp. UTBIF-56]
MTGLTERLPHVAAFPAALGTGLLLHTDAALNDGIRDRIGTFIDTYESALSRFRGDSTVGRMRTAGHGGTFDFPEWCGPLFDLYDRLFDATDGAIDPCVGEDLIRLGYDAAYSFAVESDAAEHAGAIHGRAVWPVDVERHGTTLVTHGPVALDFGACGKGYLVDLIAEMLEAAHAAPQPVQYVIDAGGDLLIHTNTPITIALEDPANPANAVGAVGISQGAFCASAPSRRHWGEAAGHQLHHLLNAIDGLPVDEVAATWVAVEIESSQDDAGRKGNRAVRREVDREAGLRNHDVPPAYSTALADGLATALFTTPANQLRAHFDFDCAILNTDRTAAQSAGFPGSFFVR